jgi:hypothetical protein
VRKLTHEAAFVVFVVTLPAAVVAGLAAPLIGAPLAIAAAVTGSCLAAALIAYAAGWLTEPTFDEPEACPQCRGLIWLATGDTAEPVIGLAPVGAVVGGGVWFQAWATRPARKRKEI